MPLYIEPLFVQTNQIYTPLITNICDYTVTASKIIRSMLHSITEWGVCVTSSTSIAASCFTTLTFFFIWNALWSSDAIWRNRSGSTLAQAIACLTAPSHYLNQCWHIIGGASDIHPKGICIADTQDINHKMSLNITYLKLLPNLPDSKELTAYCIDTIVLFNSWYQSCIIHMIFSRLIIKAVF